MKKLYRCKKTFYASSGDPFEEDNKIIVNSVHAFEDDEFRVPNPEYWEEITFPVFKMPAAIIPDGSQA